MILITRRVASTSEKKFIKARPVENVGRSLNPPLFFSFSSLYAGVDLLIFYGKDMSS